MKNKIIKILISVILVTAAVFSVTSCDRKYNEEEVLEAAKALIEDSKKFNLIYWGEGIPYVRDESSSNGYYYPANPIEVKKMGFETVEELKEITGEVFSESYCKSIFSSALSSYGDEDGIYGLTRYYQKYSDAYMTEPECIMVYSRATVFLTDEVEYLYDTMVVTGSKKETVYVKLSVNVTRDDKTQTREMKVGLCEEASGWRLDTPTYITYYEEQN